MAASKQKPFNTEALRSFYFSGATNYAAYKNKQEKTAEKSAEVSPARSAADGTVATTAGSVAPAPVTVAAGKGNTTAAGSAVHAARGKGSPTAAAAASTSGVVVPAGAGSDTTLVGHSADAVSPAYIAFLQMQRDLSKTHGRVTETLDSLHVAKEHRTLHQDDAGTAAELLAQAEASSGWNWKSKFTREALVGDAGLIVPRDELHEADELPKLVSLQHMHQQFVRLRQDHAHDEDPAAQGFKLLLDNGVRRFDRLLKEFGDSQLDSAPVTHLCDNMVVQLDHVLALPPLRRVLQEIDDTIAVISRKHKQCVDLREQALEDGAMDVAERESYRLVDLSEELATAQVERIRLLTSIAEEHSVSAAVRDAYAQQAADDTTRLNERNADLKSRCEGDLARLYQLKRQVDETEKHLSEKWQSERKASDDRLATIQKRKSEAWEQIEMLVKQLGQLEKERHQECKRRIDEKVKDESRRNEFGVFNAVAEEHAATLDRTIRNCDVHIHCAKLMHELLNSGFSTIGKHLTAKKSEVDTELFAAHKKHLEVFRGLLFTLGDLEYKKGKRIEEVEANVETAHVQQELCSDSLNPNAKKFSDAKKELLRIRDHLELEMRELRERQAAAKSQYAPTEAALVAASFDHRNPVEELEDWLLGMRAKMVEYRMLSLGNVSSAPIHAELAALRKNFDASRKHLSTERSRATPGGAASPPL